ncbi:nucleobindin-2-like [Adelges cooleyi]|uniref:nucleobindin-2-like n=1 Tax=Adelges cooleyi TaxID=133065 RepID=UPI00218019DC|nr:nucleobindin-2-like [Adelges cooleyi]
MALTLCKCLALLFLIENVVCAPPSYVTSTRPSVRLSDQEFEHLVKEEQEQNPKTHQEPPNEKTLDDLGIEYNRYLREVVEALEKDEDFKKKLETADEADIRTGKIADELDYVHHHIRSKLDELKRQELMRLRSLTKNGYSDMVNEPGHVDHQNPHSFEKKDLLKLIKQVAQDLEEADEKRKQMFKEYEMQKHFEREQKLKQMTDAEREKFLIEEKAAEAQRENKHKSDPIHSPGSKKQLEEVWEKQDQMEGEEFNPRAFFAMHDIDGNSFWDEDEVKTLFLRELDKLYNQGMSKVDLMEKAEEMERMREHVFNEMDVNRDRLISWDEFKRVSEQPAFEKDEGWKTIDQNEIYTNDELKKFEQHRQQQVDQMIQNGRIPQYPPEYYQHHPEIPNPSLHHGPNYQVNSNQYHPQYMGHPQQAQQPYVHPQQAQQPYVHPQQAQQPYVHQQQAQQPYVHPQQAQQQNDYLQQQQQFAQPVRQVPQNQQPAAAQQAQSQQQQQPANQQLPQAQPQQQQNVPPVQQYAPQQQQYQAGGGDTLKNQKIKINDVESNNKIIKNSKENYGKTGHVAGTR